MRRTQEKVVVFACLLCNVLAFGAPGDLGNFCPDSNFDDSQGPKANQCSPLRSYVGDPVSIVDGYTLHGELDFSMQSALHKLDFVRRYVSRDGLWGTTQVPVHPPFGLYSTQFTRWTHSLYSYARKTPTQNVYEYRNRSGRLLGFTCPSISGWADHYNVDAPWTLEDIWCDMFAPGQANGFFIFDRGSGDALEYRAKYYGTDGSQYPYYFLSAVGRHQSDGSNRLVNKFAVNYGTPIQPDGGTISGGCTFGGAGGTSDPGVPYIQTIVSDEGGKAWLTYEKLSGECVLKQVNLGNVADGGLGGAAPAVTYEYSGNGMLSGVKRHQTNALSESYTYSLSGSPVAFQYGAQGGVPLLKHTYDSTCNAIKYAETPTEKLVIGWGTDQCAGSEASFPGSSTVGFPRGIVNEFAGKGNGSTGPPAVPGGSVYTKYWATITPLLHQGRFGALQTQGACSPPEACVSGTETLIHPSNANSPRNLASQSKNQYATNKYDVAQWQDSSFDGNKRWEISGRGRSLGSIGMPALGACAAGEECEWYGYTYSSPWNIQLPASTTRKTIVPGYASAAGTSQLYESWTGRTWRTSRSGGRKKLDGTLETVSHSTFYFSSHQSCTGAAGAIDPLGRTLEVHGPCVPNAIGNDCLAHPYPVMKYVYYGSTGTNNANRLNSLTRYTNGCSNPGPSTGLTQTINAYDVAGNVTSLTGENGVSTTMTYDRQNRLLSRTTNALTTSFSYKYGELEWVQHPEGNYEVYGHLNGSGLWTPVLQWKAKASNSSGTQWSERIDYARWPDGTVKTETYSARDSVGTVEVRQLKQYAADAQGRPTYEGWGATAFTATKRFDANNNVTGVGMPYNAPPTFCSGGSKTCADLAYDAWDRLSKLTQYPQTTSNPGIESRFCHDGNRNLTAVALGSTSSNFSCISGQGSGTYLDKAVTYEYDDFGNVTAVTEPNASGGASTRGTTRFEYDFLRNVVKKQTEAQRSNNDYTSYSYDTLGRLLEERPVIGGLPANTPSYAFAYDNSVSGPNADCPQPANTLNRVKRISDSGGYVFFTYDAWGRVLREQRVRTLGTSCATTIDNHPATSYSYSSNGNVLWMTYPHGRLIQYIYKTTNGANDRVDKVQIWAQLAWQGWVDVVRKIEWEPYGALRGYELAYTNGPTAGLEYHLGGTGSSLPTTGSSCPTLATVLSGGSDYTGRLRAVWLSNGNYVKGSTSATGDLYKRIYTWAADQVARVDTCTINSNSVREDYGPSLTPPNTGYDQLLRLKKVRAPLLSTTGGPVRQRNYDYDARSNRTGDVVDEFGSNYVHTYSSTAYQPDLLTRHKASLPTSLSWRDYAYDKSGRITSVVNPFTDSSGLNPHTMSMSYSNAALRGGSDSVFRSVSVNGATFTYYYDAFNRRRAKAYPTDVTDEFFYSTSGLIEDRGLFTTSTAAPYPIDEYIWLDGRPIAAYRSNFSSSWVRTYDFQGSCQRNGVAADCGLYFIVTDHLGKPTLMLSSTGAVSGVGEYDPFGAVNRVPAWGETYHPYPSSNMLFMDVTQPQNGLSMKVRFNFTVMDVEPNLPSCNTGGDWVRIKDWYLGTNLTSLQGYHRGQLWSDWVTPTAPHGRLLVYMEPSSAVNKGPTSCQATWAYTGASIREYEYQRYQTAQPFWTPMRLPGQYFDQETDLFENRNRYYEPLTGRYFSQEPLLQDADYGEAQAYTGHAVPAYAYALSNPVGFVDPNGLEVVVDKSCPEKVSKIVSTFKSSVNSSKDCPCKQLIDEYGVLELLTTDTRTVTVICDNRKSGACGNVDPDDDSAAYVASKPFGSCPATAKTILHELVHAVNPTTQNHNTMTDKEIWDKIEGCIKPNGTLVQ
jgi:RHS repeat-associated protein